MPLLPLTGPSYDLLSRPASVQRTVNLIPVPLEPGNERAGWVLKDVPGLSVFQAPPSLSIDKAQSGASLEVDDAQVYTVVVTNSGTVLAAPTIITDDLPAGFVFVSCTIAYAGGATGPATATEAELLAGITVTAFPLAATVTLTISGSFNEAGTYENTAIATPSGGASVEDTVETVVTEPEPEVPGLFVAVARTGTADQAMTSVDGETWVSRTTPTGSWRAVCWSPELSLFCAVGFSTGEGSVMTSPDGVTWTARTAAAENVWNAVCWSPELELFCAVGEASSSVMTSPDGINWTSRTPSDASSGWRGVCWSPDLGLFCAVARAIGEGVAQVMTSPDGINWTTRTPASNIDWYAVIWEGTRFVAAGSTTTPNDGIMTSEDGLTWTAREETLGTPWVLIALAKGDSRIVCLSVDNVVSRNIYSDDTGTTWTVATPSANREWRSVAWSPYLEIFAAVAASGSGSRTMTTPDGITWTSHEAAVDNNWYSVVWGTP
jgi:uncharacterized repeat protein (TIGR01451 family)